MYNSARSLSFKLEIAEGKGFEKFVFLVCTMILYANIWKQI